MTIIDERKEFASLINTSAFFLKIKDDTKSPTGSFLPGKRNRFKRIPSTKNYGVIPVGNLIILDLDNHKGGVIGEQIQLFSKLLGVDLRRTLTVETPSGGRHIYLRLPNCEYSIADIPKTSLRGFSKEIKELTDLDFVIETDIRSEAANAYVLGPGSSIDGVSYFVSNPSDIITIPKSGFKALALLPKMKEKSRKESIEKKKTDLWSTDSDLDLPPIAAKGQSLDSNTPPTIILNKLRKKLSSMGTIPYHQRRAIVKAALQCCYSIDGIAKACIALDINRDTSTGKPIHRFSLQTDIYEFNISESFHGPYCPVGLERLKLKKRQGTEWDLKEYLDSSAEKRKNGSFIKVDPKVLDVQKISSKLLENGRRRGKTYKNSMRLVQEILQPMSNVGAAKILLSRDFITTELDITPTQAAEAMKLLRSNRIIEIRNKQKQGFAPTYTIHEDYIHSKMTFYLKRTWLESKDSNTEPLVVSVNDHCFYRAISKEKVEANTVAKNILKSHNENVFYDLPIDESFSFLSKYLKSLN